MSKASLVRPAQLGRIARAALVSVAVHLAALVVISMLWPGTDVGAGSADERALVTDLASQPVQFDFAPEVAKAAPAPAAMIDETAADLALRLGDTDSIVSHESSPNPRSDVELPDTRAAGAGGGGAGGLAPFTGRSDPGDIAMTTVPTTGAEDLRVQRSRHDDGRASKETIRQTPEPGIADDDGAGHKSTGALREDRGRASPRPGSAKHAAAPAAASEDDADDPMLARAARIPPAAVRAETAARPKPVSAAGNAPVARGPESTETDTRGKTADDLEVAERSGERRPGALERTPPTAGGVAGGAGVKSPKSGSAVSAKSSRESDGQGGTRLPVDPGELALRTRRAAQTSYLRALQRKVDGHWNYPDELRLNLQGGQAIVQLTLRTSDGSVTELKFLQRSEFSAFDREVSRALKSAGPFGAVPKVLTHAETFTMTAPFQYENPLIR